MEHTIEFLRLRVEALEKENTQLKLTIKNNKHYGKK